MLEIGKSLFWWEPFVIRISILLERGTSRLASKGIQISSVCNRPNFALNCFVTLNWNLLSSKTIMTPGLNTKTSQKHSLLNCSLQESLRPFRLHSHIQVWVWTNNPPKAPVFEVDFPWLTNLFFFHCQPTYELSVPESKRQQRNPTEKQNQFSIANINAALTFQILLDNCSYCKIRFSAIPHNPIWKVSECKVCWKNDDE
jgi:hypothetical protein